MARRHSCGGDFVKSTGTLTTTIRGVTVEVQQDELQCSGCGEVRVSLESAERAEERAAELVRDRLGLLHPSDIRELRDALGLTQADLESQLGLGPKTVVRWESGRVMQNKATDNLLRLVRRDSTALAFLAGLQDDECEGAGWPPWLRLPKSLRRRLEERAAEEGTDLRSLVVMILSEQITLDGVTKSLRLRLDRRSAPNEADVEPWLEEHRNQYETAT